MYRLGIRSLLELRGVHPDLVAVVKLAIEASSQDFRVYDGLRSEEEQEEYFARGASHTMNSKHLRQDDGYGHAVDLVPLIAGRPRWEWPAIYPVAAAMHYAATRINVPITWGGAWDRSLLELAPAALEIEVENYVQRMRGRGRRRVLIDGPHYQIGVPT